MKKYCKNKGNNRNWTNERNLNAIDNLLFKKKKHALNKLIFSRTEMIFCRIEILRENKRKNCWSVLELEFWFRIRS